ncbi:MAG: hypothetical protein IIA07_08145 [Proteobacteria bacterium]|nr:hypothetical protein [Pseudomonadota bacterium]
MFFLRSRTRFRPEISWAPTNGTPGWEFEFKQRLDGGILESLGRLFKGQLKNSLHHLFNYLKDRQCIVTLEEISHDYLDIHSPEVLDMITSGSSEWKEMVPEGVATAIVERKLFGFSG